MGTTVSNLQILGASEEDVRAALPKALVGTWSERFVTACPDLAFQSLERKAGLLSKKLACAVLSVSMFDGDTLSLVLYQDGKRLSRHVVNPETGERIAGNPKLFCTALGLPEELAPKLKRLFEACSTQEDKLDILQVLLGTPLYMRRSSKEDGYLPKEPVRADSGPLEKWVREHPEPPKLKNQCKAELIQEVFDLKRYHSPQSSAIIFRRVAYADENDVKMFGCKPGDAVGTYAAGGYWAHPLPDGQLELTPLADPDTAELYAMFRRQPPEHLSSSYDYAYSYSRLITADHLYQAVPSIGFQREQTVIVHDTAGILPCPLPLSLEDDPIAANGLYLMPDGGFIAGAFPKYDDSCPKVQIREPALIRYGPDGAQKWVCFETNEVVQVTKDRIYARPGSPLVLDMNGNLIARSTAAYARGSELRVLNGVPYVLESCKPNLLRRLTPDLQPAGKVHIPDITSYFSSLVLSPDGTLLYAAGCDSGLWVIDAGNLQIIRNLPKKGSFPSAAVDSQNRLWAGSGACIECYTPELECISRHRLKGEIETIYRNDFGQVCAITSQQKTNAVRVYRFS